MTRKVDRVYRSVHTADGHSIITTHPSLPPSLPPRDFYCLSDRGRGAEHCHSLVFAIVQSGRRHHSSQRD